MTFPTKTIREVTETLIDYRGKTPTKTSMGVKLITAKVIKDGFIEDGSHEFIAPGQYDSWMRRGLPRQWDILITTEAPLGELAQLRSPEKVALAQRVILLRGKEPLIDQSYFFHALKSPFVQAGLKARSTGTTVLGIKQSELWNVQIPYPPLPTQKKIASVLSAYDDLIENNTRRITILEQMAQMLYREWFVNFRFPGYNKIKMVESEVGVFPEGWSLKKLGDVLTLVYGKALKAEDRIHGGIPVFGSSGVVGHHAESLTTGPGIVVGRKGNVGSVFFCHSDFWVIDTAYYVSTELPLHYVYFNLLTQNFLNNDAAVPGLNRNQAHSLPIHVPEASILERFEGIVGPLIALKVCLVKKNSHLRATRDLLLPRLISGEVSVEQIETEAAAQTA